MRPGKGKRKVSMERFVGRGLAQAVTRPVGNEGRILDGVDDNRMENAADMTTFLPAEWFVCPCRRDGDEADATRRGHCEGGRVRVWVCNLIERTKTSRRS